MDGGLIVVRQLPVIEDQLRQVQTQIEARVRAALEMPCTEDTRKAVKQVRAELTREYQDLEARRKEVKRAILEPYERFEAVYRQCAGDLYVRADAQLKSRVDEVEGSLRREKEASLRIWFAEYRASLGLDEAFGFERSGIRVTLSASEKSLRERAKAFLDRVAGDLRLIGTLEDRDEVLSEYRKRLDVSQAVTEVDKRHKDAEAERAAREAREARQAEMAAAAEKVEAYLLPPAAMQPSEKDPDEVIPRLTFTALGATRRQLRKLREFLKQEGIRYE